MAQADKTDQPGSAAASGDTARPLRKDAALNRERILTAAAEVFAERGLDVSLDDIARHAGLGVGTVYRRFPTKELLTEALFQQHVNTLTALAEAALTAENSWDGLVTVLTDVCAMQATNRGLREVLLSSNYGENCAAQARDRLKPAIAAALERAQRDGYLRSDIVPVDMILVEFMIGAVAQYTRHAPDAWRRYLHIMIDGLRARPDLGDPQPPAITHEQLDEAMLTWRPKRG